MGQLDNIEFVVILTKYKDKWVFCWHKKRESFENPGGHVEKGETPIQAAKRELYEETGITDCEIIPLWDYEQPCLEKDWDKITAIVADATYDITDEEELSDYKRRIGQKEDGK
ncbi:NUDIX domain-containing protein [Butyrivibrio sp. INlla16]|uniref:NUDIX domain-containing protein n=1 Tax=Butyrivibrio sp. INlla16 TaxID=1520807 RepID=UPI00088A74F8|nr:NUDIX domain-containing protein [Butyrivibrio sp. INlla16]SDB69836.1 NUDIX domain-containing protein [Butyrivibrio sp. INlla16]